jgi:hypothetical protein
MRQEKKSDGRETERKKRRIKETVEKSGRKKYDERNFVIFVQQTHNLCYLFLVGPNPICRALQTAIGPTSNKIPDTLVCNYSHQIHNDILSKGKAFP